MPARQTEGADLYVHYGCGFCAPATWLNFDNSPTMRFERIPMFGQMYTKNKRRFPDNVRYGDIVRGLPVAEGAASAVYSSHMLDYLAYEDLKVALRNTKKILRRNGIFRLVVADCALFMHEYLNSKSTRACSLFMERTGWGRKASRRFGDFAMSYFGHRHRLWMWDFKGLSEELENAGFSSIRPAKMGDNEDPRFRDVEDFSRWEKAIGLECRA